MDGEDHYDDGGNELNMHTELIHHRQIDGARGTFEAMVRQTNNLIDTIKRSNLKREKDRRFEEEIKRQERFEASRNEAMMAARRTAELDMRWSEYKEMEECQELSTSMAEHKKMFQSLIKKKQELIDMLQNHIRFKDEEYISEMEQMKDEIDQIVHKMRAQFRELRDLVRSELGMIEEDLDKQRGEMINAMKTEINDKFANHKKTEEEAAEARVKEEADNAMKLELLRIENEKEFMKIKINLEIEIQNCEKCYEDMKALYQLNSEKLKYNKEVLEEKLTENTKLHDDLKKRATEYRDQAKRKEDEYKKSSDDLNLNNKKLTKQYISISRQYKDLHKKYKHFEITDKQKYREIKKMNLEEISKIKERIRNCDRIIHQHQLGVLWEPFDEETIVKEELGEEEIQEAGFGHGTSEEEDEEHMEEDRLVAKIPDLEMNAILNLILIELDFLLDDKVSSELNKENSKMQLLIKLNVLRKVLAIKDEAEMNRLLASIYTEAKKHEERDGDGSVFSKGELDPEAEGKIDVGNYNPREFDEDEKRAGEEEHLDEEHEPAGQDIYEVEQKYDPNTIISILSKFIEEKKKNVVLNNADADVQTKKIIQMKNKERAVREQRIFLARMSKALPNERLKMWKVLDKISTQYYELLLNRQRDIEETTLLHTQNDELKNLLNQYLKVNHNLNVPPIDMIKVNFLE